MAGQLHLLSNALDTTRPLWFPRRYTISGDAETQPDPPCWPCCWPCPSRSKRRPQESGSKEETGRTTPKAMQVVNLAPAKIAGEIPGDVSAIPTSNRTGPPSPTPPMARSTPSTSNGTTRTPTACWCAAAIPTGKWGAPVAIDDGNWDHYSPTIVGPRQRRAGHLVRPVATATSISSPPRFRRRASLSKPERLTTRALQRLQSAPSPTKRAT